jgi:hypothetical protein
VTSTSKPAAIEELRDLLRATPPKPSTGLWEDLAIAVSLTNLCYLRSWGAIRSAGSDFLSSTPAGSHLGLATPAGALLLGAVLFACVRLVRTLRGQRSALALDALVSCAFFCVVFRIFTDVETLVQLFGVPVTSALLAGLSRLSAILGAYGSWLALVLVYFGLLGALVRNPAPVLRWTRRLVLILSPWFVINAGQTLWQLNAHSRGTVHAENRAATRALPVSRSASPRTHRRSEPSRHDRNPA